MSRLPLAIVCACLVLAISGCGDQQSSQPPGFTFSSIKAALNKSNMKSAHFSVVGNVVRNGASYAIQGDGVLQRLPAAAVETNLTVLTNSAAGDVQLQQIQIGGKVYSRTGTGAWSSQPDTSTVSPLNPTGYSGEDSRNGQAVWHLRSSDALNSYDMWIRESDAYIVLISYKDSSGESLNFIMNSYNKSPVIIAPS